MSLELLFPIALVLLLVAFFFSQMKRKREMAALQAKLLPGVCVMTSFGLFGTLKNIDDEKALLEIAPGCVVSVHARTIARVEELQAPGEQVLDERPEDTDVLRSPEGASVSVSKNTSRSASRRSGATKQAVKQRSAAGKTAAARSAASSSAAPKARSTRSARDK
ncbi:preprotein translocase subunit YajC [Tropheryma whipplei]|uniref:preprotein translocase subunit YajC n=1 Tax=Tropheryma whipplei TaxID=2039 RepID=UPI0004B52B22|nr:preprotein translocase subunit YajC [Tropheryma whipplei]MCO8190235.1 preprotein translocase subunit YajC [Tropheryma whipplei]